MEAWLTSYALQRYGPEASQTQVDKGWHVLGRHVFNSTEVYGLRSQVIHSIPELEMDPVVWYPYSDVVQAWDYIMSGTTVPELATGAGYRLSLIHI